MDIPLYSSSFPGVHRPGSFLHPLAEVEAPRVGQAYQGPADFPSNLHHSHDLHHRGAHDLHPRRDSLGAGADSHWGPCLLRLCCLEEQTCVYQADEQ